MSRAQSSPVVPTEHDARLAETARQALAQSRGAPIQLQVKSAEPGAVPLDLPPAVTRVLLDALTETAAGHAVALVPVETEITTQAAADLLNVSRPFLIRLVEDGVLPVRKVGNRRRLPLENVLAYKADNRAKRRDALKQLVALEQDLGLE